MSTLQKKTSILSTGLAMFAMFFGAGNIVFPLAVGQLTLDKNIYAVLGMTLTAVLIPLAGLLAMMLFEGDYNAFFRRIGKIPGFFVILVILAVIGPFGGIPRCITITHSTLSNFGIDKIPGVNLITFSFFSCLLIFLFTWRPRKIVSLIGYVLTPILLLSLAVIVIKGVLHMPSADVSVDTRWQTFSLGIVGGYNTMDLLAAFFFSSIVLVCIKPKEDQTPLRANRSLFFVAIAASIIAACLLTFVYVCFSFLAAGYSAQLTGVAAHQMLGKLAYDLLGPFAGLVVGIAVSFACLTTEIALAAIVADFLHKRLLKERFSYVGCLIVTLAISFCISTLHFEGISSFLVPVLQLCYPALIALTVVNLMYKLFSFQPVKSIFYGTVAVTLLLYFAKI